MIKNVFLKNIYFFPVNIMLIYHNKIKNRFLLKTVVNPIFQKKFWQKKEEKKNKIDNSKAFCFSEVNAIKNLVYPLNK